MPNILTELSDWASTLPYWEQAALDQIVSGTPFNDVDYDQLIQYLLEDEGLREQTSSRPSLRLSQLAKSSSESAAEPVRLRAISDLRYVNALAPGQTLPFGPTLTVIFGANGSGKSGYARILGCAGFTRGDQEILPDITDSSAALEPRSAEIEVSVGNTVKTIHYEVGKGCPELSPFYVFDSTSVAIHLSKLNKISFCPAGLAHLTCLSQVLDECAEKLRKATAPYLKPHNFGAGFHGESEVSRAVAGLSSKTDLTALKRLATLTAEEQRHLTDLDLEIARFKSQDIGRKIEEVKQTINDLSRLIMRLQEIGRATGDAAMEEINKAIESAANEQALAQRASLDQFKSADFTSVGSSAWRRFVEAASVLAAAESTQGEPYPEGHDRCLLCRQSLSDEARDLLHGLWAFLEDESQARLDAARAGLEQSRKALAAVELDCFNDQHVSYRHLMRHDQTLGAKVAAFVEAAHQRRAAAVRAINDLTAVPLPPPPESGVTEIEGIIEQLRAQQAELEQKNPNDEILELDKQLLGLKHRATLGERLSEIVEYVEKSMWAEKANKAIGTTRHITQKYNELFKQLVTEQYVRLFERTLRELNCPLRVRVKTKGQKGETHKQIFLETDPSSDAGSAKPEKVLSEGEKRAVALTDFLTEAALDENNRGIILDDPVTSLDWEWKETVAKRLVVESRARQVVVFTHDLHFLYLIKKYAGEEQIDLASHWIKCGGENGKPGYILQGCSPATEGDFRASTKALDYWRKAKESIFPEEQESLLHLGFDYLRVSYEALVVYELFGRVVMRFEERISLDRLKDVITDRQILDEVMNKVSVVSRYIGGHLHSDAFQAQKPTPEMLKREIDEFDELRKKVKKAKAASKK